MACVLSTPQPRRERLERLDTMCREALAGLSRLIGRDEGYLQCHVARGVPSKLRREDIALLSRLGVPPEDLGGEKAKRPA